MKQLINELIKNKKVLILGFGREGRSSYKIIKEIGGYKSLSVADYKDFSDELQINEEMISGEAYQSSLNEYDVVLKSPGIVLEKEIDYYKTNITSQAELFLRKYGENIIGITGTKGKSTISTMLYHILSENKVPSILVGNIGIPFFDVIEDIKEDTKIVCEFSSHQLEFNKFSPHIAVLSNIYEEHLDHYGIFEKYYQAKMNIYAHQNKNDILICNNNLFNDIKNKIQNIYTVDYDNEKADINILNKSFVYNKKTFEVDFSKISLIGRHNLYNIAIVKFICDFFEIEDEDFYSALNTYKSLPHRLENIGTKNGVTYYNDSISTTCECAIAALTSLEDVGTILIGGMDRGINYNPLIEFLSDYKIDNIILMYASGKRIYDTIKNSDFKNQDKVVYIENLNNAVAFAKKNTKQNKICLLSPAAPSYGYFKNFEDRGNCFKNLAIFE